MPVPGFPDIFAGACKGIGSENGNHGFLIFVLVFLIFEERKWKITVRKKENIRREWEWNQEKTWEKNATIISSKGKKRRLKMEQKKKISLFEKLVYGSGQIGMNVMYTLFSSYVLLFYTDVVGITPAMIGGVILASKVFDGVSDLIAGQFIDTHKTAKGHCVPVLAKWSIPMVLSVVAVFAVPNTGTVLRLIFIFITYNLFNTVLYTFTSMAYATLPTYVTSDSIERSQMQIYAMLFAGATQTVMASTIMPMLEFFGGMNLQTSWIKTCLVFGIVGLIFLLANAFFVKERVDNPKPPENIIEGVKYAVTNKYWLMCLVMSLATQVSLMFMLSISVYYLGNVVNNMQLMGAFIACSNLPGVFLMMFMPSMLKKVPKQKMYLTGCLIMLVANVTFFIGPSDSVPLLLGTALLRGIGFGFPMGLNASLVGDCVDYGEWKTGVRVQSPLFSANSVAQKIGQGLLTSLFGFFLTAIGYDGLKEVQAASTISGINYFFKLVPIAMNIILIVCAFNFKLEKQMPQIVKELQEKREASKA